MKNPTTKSEEIAILRAAAESLGADSYCGPWLLDVLPEILREMRSDNPPAPLLPHQANAHAVVIHQRATDHAALLIANAEKRAAEIVAAAQARVDRIVGSSASALRDSLRSLERL